MNRILSFCREVGIPEDHTDFFANAYSALESSGGSNALNEAVRDYLADKTKKAPEVTETLAPVAAKAGVHQFTLNALFVILAFGEMRELYIGKYGEEIYRDTAGDLANKIRECIQAEGVIGITAISWYHLFLREVIFALGRLQFHIVPFPREVYEKNGNVVRKDQPIIKLHIPSSGKLTADLCFDAYRRAYRFFKSHFEGDVLPFMCTSWMLYERNLEFFPEGGNLARFMSDFDIIENDENPDHPDLWRIFGKKYTDFTELPRDTSLRAAMADYLLAGNPMGHGFGVFFHDGKNIIK